MRKTLILLLNTLRRSRIFLLVALFGGGLMCLTYAGMSSLIGQMYEGIPIGFYPHEETAVTADLRSYLAGELGMQVTESTDTEILNTELVEKHIAAVVEVPPGFEAALLSGNAIPLQVSFLDDYANSAFVMGYLENYTASLATLALGANGNAGALESMMDALQSTMVPPDIQESDSDAHIAATQQNAFRQVIGFYLMFCFLLAFGLSTQLLDDRKKGLYARMKASSLRTVQYLAGTCVPNMLAAILLIAPFFVYVAATGQSTGMHIWQAALLCFIYALFVMAFGIVAAMYLSSRNALTAAIVGTATITCMLGGAYFPLSTSPQFLQQLARAMPQYWLMDAVYTLQADPTAGWLLHAGILSLFALLFFIVAGIRFVQGGKRKRAAQ